MVIDDFIKLVERLETETLLLCTVGAKIRVQGGRRYGTLPALDSEFPITSIGDDVVDGYEGPNEFAKAIQGLCSVGIDNAATVFGAVRIGEDGYAGASDSGNLLWTRLPLLENTGREVMLPIASLSPIANMIGNIKVRVSDKFIEVISDRGVYRATFNHKEPPPYVSLIDQRTDYPTTAFPLAKILLELEAFTKAVTTGAIVDIRDRQITVSTPYGSLVEYNSVAEHDGDLRCKFYVTPKDFLPVAKILKGDCEVYLGETSHLTLKAQDTIAIISCLEGSLSFS